jgi:hypothetical protein
VNPTRRRCTRAVITFTLPGPCCRLRSVSVSVCQCGKHVEVWIMCPILGPISTPPDHQGSLGLIKSHQISSVLISARQGLGLLGGSSVLISAHRCSSGLTSGLLPAPALVNVNSGAPLGERVVLSSINGSQWRPSSEAIEWRQSVADISRGTQRPSARSGS